MGHACGSSLFSPSRKAPRVTLRPLRGSGGRGMLVAPLRGATSIKKSPLSLRERGEGKRVRGFWAASQGSNGPTVCVSAGSRHMRIGRLHGKGVGGWANIASPRESNPPSMHTGPAPPSPSHPTPPKFAALWCGELGQEIQKPPSHRGKGVGGWVMRKHEKAESDLCSCGQTATKAPNGRHRPTSRRPAP